MEKDAVCSNSKGGGETRLGVEANDDHIGLANTIKLFHYRLQQRMSADTAVLPLGVGQKEEEGTQENEEARWFRLISEEGQNMKAYATAMHDIATRYWDPCQEGKKTTGRGFPSHVASTTGGVTLARSRRPRGTNREETSNQLGQPTCGSLRYNDRVAYSLHCVADYYLGSCVPLANIEPQLQKRRETRPLDSSEESSDPQHFSVAPCSRIYERIPRIATTYIKAWRRAFYAACGRQATASEVEAAAYDALTLHGYEGEKSNEADTNALSEPLPHKTLRSNYAQGRLKGDSAASLAGVYMSLTHDAVRNCSSTSSGDTPLLPALPLQVLDVGSCYGPFRGKEVTNGVLQVSLEVTALDLCPFEGSGVLQADWLAVRFYDVGERRKGATSEAVETEDGDSSNDIKCATAANPGSLVRFSADADGVGKMPRGPLWVARGQFDAVFFCLMLSFLPHPRLRYRACLYAHLALKDGGLLVIVSTRTQCTRRGSWIDDWIACIEGIGFKRVHKHIMGQIVGMSFSKQAPPDSAGDTAAWIRGMMDRPEAEGGLRILGDESR
ncbi:methyltransferase [Trypanosoma rangeli]|uniref:Probable methyltransferase BMT2 homolog n=1 Tax=Trypanosoma rangeli TaxID=5698 RepID=A0A3R7NJ73_TRYRA|nr:methyltransferase [Trypanosoma rangeli]RNF07266.1 methyltransferase [Trypanosoma rangeli]|eukprot:RNF07266.1 methyltransferase [Trypanosoma rangeli]